MKNRLTHQAAISSGRLSFGTPVPRIERLSLRSGHRGVFLPGCRVRRFRWTTPDAAWLIPRERSPVKADSQTAPWRRLEVEAGPIPISRLSRRPRG